MGLHLHADKTRITHTLTPYQGQVGFDFVGFNIRQESVEKPSPGKHGQESSLGMKTFFTSFTGWLAPQESSLRVKTIINPSQEAVKRHLAAIDQRLQQLQTASQARVIEELNPLIIGWVAYYNGVVPAASMSRYDDLVEQRLVNWASKRHPGKARDWLLARYWHRSGNHRRIFATPEGVQLRTYRQTSILRG
jgi:RNA-directed DNA polymerase